MTTHTATKTAIDEMKAKAAIDAVRNRPQDDVPSIDFTQQARRAKLQRKSAKELRSLIPALDPKKIDHMLQADQALLRDTVAEQSKVAARQMAELKTLQLPGLENTRRALEAIAFKPYLTTLIPVHTPFIIGARPVGFLTDSLVLPWDSWAKAAINTNQDTSGSSSRVSFYFLWQNPTDYLAVINCATDLALNGTVGLDAKPGFFSEGNARAHVRAELNVFVGETTINWQQSQKADIEQLSADGGNIFGFGDVVNETIFTSVDLACQTIEVQGNAVVVFEVAFVVDYAIDDGHVVLDFTAEQAIVCPVLNVELLTPPAPDFPPL